MVGRFASGGSDFVAMVGIRDSDGRLMPGLGQCLSSLMTMVGNFVSDGGDFVAGVVAFGDDGRHRRCRGLGN